MENKKKSRIKDQIEKNSFTKTKAEKSPKKGDLNKLIEIGLAYSYFRDQNEIPYCRVVNNRTVQNLMVTSNSFRMLLGRDFFLHNETSASPDLLRQAVHHFEAVASFGDTIIRLDRRVSKRKNTIYYDLCSPKGGAVKISSSGYEIMNKDLKFFQRNSHMSAQVLPKSSEPQKLLKLLAKHFQTKRVSDLLLLATHIITCFIPDIPHTILIFMGEKGAAKSTSMRMVRAIVDPSNLDLLSMPSNNDSLALALNNNYMSVFDNIDRLSPDISDLLCMASTGGSISKRKLFTDIDEVTLELKRCVVLNGINNVVTRSDLLDRSVVIELERILSENRKDENKVWTSFHTDLPEILGACFSALSEAMASYPTVELSEYPRMADFAKWGYAIAQALGNQGDKFLKYYKQNQKQANDEILDSDPISACIVKFMTNKSDWQGTATSLLAELDLAAIELGIRKVGKNWPESPNALMRKMNSMRSNLEQAKISFESRKKGSRHLYITNESTDDSPPVDKTLFRKKRNSIS